MNTFRNIFKAVSGKSGKGKGNIDKKSNELSGNVLVGLKRALKHIENQSVLPRGLYKEPGFIEEINAIEGLIESGKLSDAYLQTVRSTHSIAMAIINVLASHDPIVPQNLYDHFMSPLANMESLIDDLLAKSPTFDLMMSHLRIILDDKTVLLTAGDISASVGIHMLRAVEDDAGFDSQSFEIQARVKAFEKILKQYVSGKEEAERFFASANTANRRSTSLNIPTTVPPDRTVSASGSVSVPTPRTDDSSTGTSATGAKGSASRAATGAGATAGATAGGGAGIAEGGIQEGSSPARPSPQVTLGTIQERSVKVIYLSEDKPTQDELRSALARYGTISNVIL